MLVNDVPTPTQVPGYAEARARGTTPAQSLEPPLVLPGPSALTLARLVALVATAGVLVLVVLTALAKTHAMSPYAVLVVGAALVLEVAVGLPVIGSRTVAELQNGYTTLTLRTGRRSYTGLLRPMGPGRPVWDYSGTWVLKPTGAVVSRPTPGRTAPGLYPSPHLTGGFELWTGAEWSREYRRRPVRQHQRR